MTTTRAKEKSRRENLKRGKGVNVHALDMQH
jgi:hypothetical protein